MFNLRPLRGLAACLPLLLNAAAFAQETAALHVDQPRQAIYGFGGTQTFNGDALIDFPGREKVWQALFADLKLDIFRLRNYDGYEGQQAAYEKKTRDFARAARRWSDPKQRGGKGPVRLLFTSWSPPAALKSNARVSGRSDGTDKGLENVTLARGADGQFVYGAFADWWLGSVRNFKRLAGAYPDYITLQNELDIAVSYEGCEFLPTEGIGKGGVTFAGYDRALEAVFAKLAPLGAQAPKILGPETFTIRREASGKTHVQEFVDPATAAGQATLGRLFGVSFHIYGSGAEASNPAPFRSLLEEVQKTYKAGQGGKPLFQTEFLEGTGLTSVAGMIHDTLVHGGASAYLVWIAARSVRQPGYALVYYNPYDGSVERRERFYAVKHFSAFVGEGFHRIEAQCPDPAVRLSAYLRDDNQRLVTVLINAGAQEKKIRLAPDGASFGDATTAIFRSTEGESGERWREMGALPADRLVTLPPRSAATVTFDRKKQE